MCRMDACDPGMHAPSVPAGLGRSGIALSSAMAELAVCGLTIICSVSAFTARAAVQIIQEIQEDEQVLQQCRMEPAMLPPLVEHNPGIATAVHILSAWFWTSCHI